MSLRKAKGSKEHLWSLRSEIPKKETSFTNKILKRSMELKSAITQWNPDPKT